MGRRRQIPLYPPLEKGEGKGDCQSPLSRVPWDLWQPWWFRQPFRGFRGGAWGGRFCQRERRATRQSPLRKRWWSLPAPDDHNVSVFWEGRRRTLFSNQKRVPRFFSLFLPLLPLLSYRPGLTASSGGPPSARSRCFSRSYRAEYSWNFASAPGACLSRRNACCSAK